MVVKTCKVPTGYEEFKLMPNSVAVYVALEDPMSEIGKSTLIDPTKNVDGNTFTESDKAEFYPVVFAVGSEIGKTIKIGDKLQIKKNAALRSEKEIYISPIVGKELENRNAHYADYLEKQTPKKRGDAAKVNELPTINPEIDLSGCRVFDVFDIVGWF